MIQLAAIRKYIHMRMTSVKNSSNRQGPSNLYDLYATKEDLCRIFSEDMNSLYLLSLLLTADHDKAEHCFVTGIERCSAGRPVFKQWAHSWARRIIVQNAIRAISPAPNAILDTATFAAATVPRHFENQAFVLAITHLPPFERFAFVMSTLERLLDKDCCVLLACSRRELIKARTHALELLPSCHLVRTLEESQSVPAQKWCWRSRQRSQLKLLI
jgi:DNA-directed RNA polymerase specialized sigma24 family protein